MTSSIYNQYGLSLLVYKFGNIYFLRLVSVTILCIILGGCATAYKVDQNLIKDFQEPEVSADKTGIYVIRGSALWGGARGLWVAVNEYVVADLSNSSHVYLELDAGLNSLHFVQGLAGYGYLAVDNKPGETIYAKFGYSTTGLTEVLNNDLGQTIVMETDSVEPLEEKRNNDAYDNLLINPGVLDYPIMIESSEILSADENNALVRIYRPGNVSTAFDVWNQDGYIGSTKGGYYFSVKLKPGHHVFISRSERYSVLDAELEAGKEYAIELDVGMGWNQAHIKLLPIDLNSDDGSRQVKGWKESLKATLVNQEVVVSDAIAKRIEMGFDYLDNTRKDIDSNDVSKRSLPATFGK